MYFLLPEGHSFPILGVLSLVFVFTSEKKDLIYSQQNKVRKKAKSRDDTFFKSQVSSAH